LKRQFHDFRQKIHDFRQNVSAKERIRQIRADPDLPLGSGNKAYIIDLNKFFGTFPGTVRHPVCRLGSERRCSLSFALPGATYRPWNGYLAG